jgi:hypothetical protein
MFEFISSSYYLIIILQGICVFHSIRKGNQGKWIWIIVFIPVIGSIIYLFSEVFTKRDLSTVQSTVSTLMNPVGRVKDLEKKLEFSNTFDNKVALADAYLATGSTDKAIELYESCLTGIFDDNEYVVTKLILAYYRSERYEAVVKITDKIYKSTEFKKSQAHIYYALSLENLGKTEAAEAELKTMKGKFSNFEGRVNYAQFLLRANRNEEAKAIFTEILEEAKFMKPGESRGSAEWFRKSREELSKLS